MNLPVNIREKLDELAASEDIKRLEKAAVRLSENYRRGEHISASDKTELLAYSIVRRPATFGAVSRALELSLELYGDVIGSVLDAGAGTGAAAIAAEALTDCSDIICLEREGGMRELGHIFAPHLRWLECDITKDIDEKADLVLCSYCLNELSDDCRSSVTAALAKAANKLLLIVEPGTPRSFEAMRKTREELLALGMNIIAPCPGNGTCPLPRDDWCHFTARIARSKLHKRLKGGDAPYEDEKFCFLAAAWECSDKDTGVQSSARIIRHPIIEAGKITLRLCSENGITDKLVTRSDPLFKRARKADTGDIWQLTGKE